jgi:hypothetical protein
VTSKPRRSIFSSRAGGGAEAPVRSATRWWIPARSASGALAIELSTTGAPLRWVTFSFSMSSNSGSARTARRQTLVPAAAAKLQGKHQPLQ